MTVRHSRGSYEVEFVEPSHVLKELTEHDRVVVDGNVWRAWEPLFEGLDAYIVPPGEPSKSIESFGKLCSWLAASGATRGNSRLFAVGGGVVGDLAGFAAASYARGIPLVMVPTTLLAMVDSSVGGKVGVDLPEGKNLVGAFCPPARVYVAAEFLRTLPDREFRCGAAEVWKYGFILDPQFLASLEGSPVTRDDRLTGIVETCIALKAGVVQEDEFERTGRRAILNFGHTIGHAVEAVAGYQGWTHGEAVSVGMVVEARLGEALGVTAKGTAGRVESGLASQGLPTRLPAEATGDQVLQFAKRDKKIGADGLAFSLLTDIGQCKLVSGVAEGAVRGILAVS